ncbi:hypothetical protein [Burkholderia ubonensis]|uniref:hypothetical protein n=1 Tax=Burkholderia ubonensis TaxID=101571 RepID=UPI000759CCC9|nr:hypothetical protein [Burkholderia ubonensis]KVP39814.1 hypothetical protein WJ87_06420 [Burkholderia ubonensis]
MQKIDFDTLMAHVHHIPARVRASDLADQTPRTLAYGYTCERDTFHVYLDEDGIHKVVYRFSQPASVLVMHKHENEGLLHAECVPDKRLYPEACDFAFCALLKTHGVHLPFTTWNDRAMTRQFNGQILRELATGLAA